MQVTTVTKVTDIVITLPVSEAQALYAGLWEILDRAKLMPATERINYPAGQMVFALFDGLYPVLNGVLSEQTL